MFVVTVIHDTGHGEESTTVLLTKSIRKAVRTARTIEKLGLGYGFYSKETGVTICRLREDHPYSKQEFKWFDGDNPPPTVIFWREHCASHYGGHDDHCWKEEWFDKKLEATVAGFRYANLKFRRPVR